MKNRYRILALVLALILSLSAMSLTAFADPDETTAPAATEPSETAPVETQASAETEAPVETEPAPTEPETEPPTEPPTEPTVEEPAEPEPIEEPEPEQRSMLRFTQDGNLTLIDDFEYVGMDENGTILSKQFITVQDRGGNYFYIIIDRVGDTENVYFLNQVDLSDLKTLANSNQQGAVTAACTCTSKCTVGHIDTTCPVCSVNMSECAVSEVTPVPTEPGSTEPTEPEEPGGSSGSKATVNPVLAVILVVAMAGILIFYFVKFKGGKGKSRGNPDAEFDDDEDEYETELAEPESGYAESEEE